VKALLVLTMMSIAAGSVQSTPLYEHNPVLVKPVPRNLVIGQSNYKVVDSCDKPSSWPRLTLSELAFYGLCTNPRVKAAEANLNIFLALQGQAVAFNLPTLSFTTLNSKRTTSSFLVNQRPELQVTAGSELQNKKGLNFTWSVFTSGAHKTGVEYADLNTRASVYDLQDQIESTLVDILIAYYDYYYAQALSDSYRHSFTLASQSVEVARQRFAKGLISKSEVLQAESMLARSEIDMQRNEEQSKIKLLSLSVLLSVNASEITGLNVTGHPIQDVIHPIRMDSDIDAILELRPSYKAYILRYEAVQLRIKQVKLEGLPRVDITGSLANLSTSDREIQTQKGLEKTLAINMTIPIFEGFGRIYKIQEALANSDNYYHEMSSAKSKIKEEVIQNQFSFNQELSIQYTEYIFLNHQTYFFD
jgi:outer membrane protein